MTIAIPSLTRVPAAERGITIGDFLVPIRVGERISPRLRHLVLVLAGALFIYLTARVSIPLPGTPVPISGQTLGVLVAGGALGLRRGLAATAVYVLLGVVGLPFFAEGKGGLSVIWGATGGYLVGFVVASALVGRLAELGWDRRFLASVGACALGNLVIYLVGVSWLAAVTGSDLETAFQQGVAPFLLGDVLKLVLAAAVFPVAWWVVGRRPHER